MMEWHCGTVRKSNDENPTSFSVRQSANNISAEISADDALIASGDGSERRQR